MVLFRSLSIKLISHCAAFCLLYNFENSFLSQGRWTMTWIGWFYEIRKRSNMEDRSIL